MQHLFTIDFDARDRHAPVLCARTDKGRIALVDNLKLSLYSVTLAIPPPHQEQRAIANVGRNLATKSPRGFSNHEQAPHN